jgi:peptidyl-prolyl cis-trans isomerase A (cyclophilin A)
VTYAKTREVAEGMDIVLKLLRGRMKYPLRMLLVALIAIVTLGATPSQERAEGWYAEVETTLGSFTIQLLPEQAPQTVAHFVAFATGRAEFVDPFTGDKKKAPYYDGLKVHKMAFARRFEIGDPTGTGHGMPPVWVPAEPGPNNFSRPYRVGMTSASMKRISGVLFFISIVAEPAYNYNHNCFGEVVEGRDVVERICNVRSDSRGAPLEPIIVRHIVIVKSGNPKPIPEPVSYEPPVPVLQVNPDFKP